MPLHLLGKKSWNVYNPESIARVRRDEAAAKRRDAEEERKTRSGDAAQRLILLRSGGTEEAQDSQYTNPPSDPTPAEKNPHRAKRRLQGENDTDRDLRLAERQITQATQSSLQDMRGHIDLVMTSRRSGETQKVHVQEEGMRFIDAAGFKQGTLNPWYSSQNHVTMDTIEKESVDRWGNDDSRRRQRERQRERQRLNTNDPLMAMKRGVRKLQENEKQRRDWMRQRERDLQEVEDMARRHHRGKRRHSDDDSLENFALDATTEPGERRHRKSHKGHHRHRSKERPTRNYSSRSVSPVSKSSHRHM